jgi:hypothetical protein
MTLGGDLLAAVILLFKLEEKYEIIDWEVEDIYDTLTIEKLVKRSTTISPKKYGCTR